MTSNPSPTHADTAGPLGVMMNFDLKHLKKPPVILKCAVIIVNLINMFIKSHGVYFYAVANFCMWFSIFMLMCHLCRVFEEYRSVKFIQLQMALYMKLIFLYMTAVTVAAIHGETGPVKFGFLATLLYEAELYFKYQELKALRAENQLEASAIKGDSTASPAPGSSINMSV